MEKLWIMISDETALFAESETMPSSSNTSQVNSKGYRSGALFITDESHVDTCISTCVISWDRTDFFARIDAGAAMHIKRMIKG